MPRIFLITFTIISSIIVLITVIGFLLPNPRITSNQFQVQAPVNKVSDQITNHKNQIN